MRTGKIAAGVSAAAFAALALTFAAGAEEPKGWVSFAALKSTLGQGFAVEPVKVPIYEGDKGADIVKRAVGEDGAVFTESDYGAYVTGFADEDTGAEVPAVIAEACPEMTGRNAAGYLSAFDYTAESGWSYFINGEYAQVGIVDYEPRDGDVLEFRFTVYGYGADLGIDNSEWGGAAALTEQLDASELIRAAADMLQRGEETPELAAALEKLSEYGASQADIDAAGAALLSAREGSAAEDGKGSPATGVGGIAVILGVAIAAVGAAAISRKSE